MHKSYRELFFDKACSAMGDEIVAGWALDGDKELLTFAPKWIWKIRKYLAALRQWFWNLLEARETERETKC